VTIIQPLRRFSLLLSVASLASVAAPARAQDEPVAPLAPAAVADADADGAELAEDEPDEPTAAELQEELRQLRGIVTGSTPSLTVSGYGDVGFFVPIGDGVGYVQDVGPMSTRAFPQYFGMYDWVFLGDILAPAINSRGEPADLGNPPGVNRQDLIDSNGAPSFIANELNLTLSSTLAENVVGVGSVNFLPRTGTDFRFGDAFDVDLLSLEWKVGLQRKTSIYVGKFESVIGIEYPERKANRRFGITPSLIARYTTGTPVGLKVRSRFGDSDWLIIAAALTNGSSVIEPFHFYDETDSNAGKTASGRLAIALPLPVRIELGVSGMYGPQDRALDSAHPMWFAGADLQVTWRWWRLGAEYLRGASDGEVGPPVDAARRVYGLRLNNGGYVQLTGLLSRFVGVLVRAEMRDAFVFLGDPTLAEGAERLYVTKSWRLTAGLRFPINQFIVAKLEYLHNGEYGGVPAIANDVFTTSLVMSWGK